MRSAPPGASSPAQGRGRPRTPARRCQNAGRWTWGFLSEFLLPVIASEAKQSMKQGRLDCFVAYAPRKKVAQERCHTTNIEPQTFIQGGSVPYPPVPTRNDGRTAPPRTHTVRYPPSAITIDPVTYADRSAARNIAGPTMSSGLPARPSGVGASQTFASAGL